MILGHARIVRNLGRGRKGFARLRMISLPPVGRPSVMA